MRRQLLWRAGGVGLAALVVAFLWLSVIATRADGAMSDCIDATCRVAAPDGGRGSGVVFEISKGHVYVLTNAHVATSESMKLIFWQRGHESQPLPGKTILRNRSADAAVVVIDAVRFGGHLPTAIPLDCSGHSMKRGQTITSTGCAGGSWSTTFVGHVVDDNGQELTFLPVPADGRSGSAIFDASGERIVGLLHARYEGKIGGSPHGIAISAARIYTAFRSPSVHQTADCPPGGCPKYGNGIQSQSQSQSQWRMMPYRSEQDDINRAQNDAMRSLYPTLPPQQRPMVPVQPPVDLRPLMEGIDRMVNGQDQIIQLLDGIRASQEALPLPPPVAIAPMAPVMPPPVMTMPDPEVAKAVVVAEAAVEAAVEVQADLEEAKAETSKLRTVVNTLIGDRDTLQDRITERLAKVKAEVGEDASRRDIATAYARDYAAEKLSGASGLTMGKMVAGALGLSGPLAAGLAAAGWLAGRRLKRRFGSDDDDGGESRLSGLIDRVSDKVDDIRDRVRGTPPAAPTVQPPPPPAVAVAPQPTIIALPPAPAPVPAAVAPQPGQVIIIPTPPVAPTVAPPVEPTIVPTVKPTVEPSQPTAETADSE